MPSPLLGARSRVATATCSSSSGVPPLLTPDLLGDVVSEKAPPPRGRRDRALLRAGRPRSYGRVLRDGDGRLTRIVEATDATAEQLSLREVNSSIYVFALPGLWAVLEGLDPHNAQGELYLTDAVRSSQSRRAVRRIARLDQEEVDGVNTRVELAAAAAALRDRVVTGHMLAGVTVVDPSTTWIEADVEIEADAVIQPFTVLRGRTTDRRRGGGGPSRRRRRRRRRRPRAGGAVLLPAAGNGPPRGAKAGTFVEVKASTIGADAKVPHLSYIGDAEIGEEPTSERARSPRTTAPSASVRSNGRSSAATSTPVARMCSSRP